ncbi:MAG: tetratricopeptide repeat protein [Candidatus Kapabacteria bacterium]|nr:tetratricopeptide repeat protein [Candidatus Kapabacteria bacterium]
MTPDEIQQAIEKLDNLWRTSQNQEAKVFAYELLEQQAIQEDAKSLANVYNILGIVYINLSDYPKALEYHSKALLIFEEIGNKNGIANVIGNIGTTYSNLSDYPKALEYYSKALLINEEIGSKVGIANNLGNIGLVYLYLSDYPKALEYLSKSLLVNEELGDKKGIAGNLGNIGNVYTSLSDYPKALEYHSKALFIAEEIGNKVGIATNLGNIGLVYHSLSDYPKALEYYLKALLINEEIGKKVGIATNLGNIGLVYHSLSDYPKALEYFSKALLINEEIGSKKGIAICLLNIGNVYNSLSDYPKALEYFSKALLINEEIGNKNGIAVNLLHIGAVKATKESTYYDARKAEEYLQKSLQLAEEIGYKEGIKEVYGILSSLHSNEKYFEKAFVFQSKVITLEKEIQSIEAKKQADRFDSERKIAEREKQLAVERAESAAIKQILHNILPASIADRIIQKETFIADHFETASVLFMDLVGFTTLASIAPPKQLVYLLDAIFQKADEVVETFGLEKIKTIGDGYLAVANVTSPLKNHQKATALASLQLLETMRDFTVNIPSDLGDTEWIKDMNDIEIRIGIHTGEVVAGIIGKNKYTYDLWGDAVNVASRMESNSEAGRIHISEEFAKSIETYPEFSLIPRGEITIKGKGSMKTFWLEKGKM